MSAGLSGTRRAKASEPGQVLRGCGAPEHMRDSTARTDQATEATATSDHSPSRHDQAPPTVGLAVVPDPPRLFRPGLPDRLVIGAGRWPPRRRARSAPRRGRLPGNWLFLRLPWRLGRLVRLGLLFRRILRLERRRLWDLGPRLVRGGRDHFPTGCPARELRAASLESERVPRRVGSFGPCWRCASTASSASSRTTFAFQ